MTALDRFDPFERRIVDAIDEIAAARTPDYLDDVFRQTARMSQRPRWFSLERWHTVNRFSYAALTVIIAAALVGGALVVSGLNQANTISGPSPTIQQSAAPSPTGSQALPSNQGPASTVENGPIVVFAGSFVSIATNGEHTVMPIAGVHSRSCPTFSPNGRILAFISGGLGLSDEHLSISDASGRNVRNLWTGEFDAQTFHQVLWSPDSAWVIATRAVDPSGGTVLGDVAGGDALVLDWRMGEFPGTFAWSPDSHRLAGIFYQAPDSTTIQVRDIPIGTPTSILTAPHVSAIAWSPDGTTLEYTAADGPGGAVSLHFVQFDGTNDRVVAEDLPGSLNVGMMAWSPDGSRLAVLTLSGESGNPFTVEVFDSEGTRVASLGPFPAESNFGLTWAPDSHAILLATGGLRDGVDHPLIVPIDGSPRQVLDVPDGYYAQCPLAWGTVASQP